MIFKVRSNLISNVRAVTHIGTGKKELLWERLLNKHVVSIQRKAYLKQIKSKTTAAFRNKGNEKVLFKNFVSHLAEEMTLFLSFSKTRQVTVNNKMGVIQHCIKPAPCGKQSLW